MTYDAEITLPGVEVKSQLTSQAPLGQPLHHHRWASGINRGTERRPQFDAVQQQTIQQHNRQPSLAATFGGGTILANVTHHLLGRGKRHDTGSRAEERSNSYRLGNTWKVRKNHSCRDLCLATPGRPSAVAPGTTPEAGIYGNPDGGGGYTPPPNMQGGGGQTSSVPP